MKKLIILSVVFLGCRDNADRLVHDCVRSHIETQYYYNAATKTMLPHAVEFCHEYKYRVIIDGRKYNFVTTSEVKP